MSASPQTTDSLSLLMGSLLSRFAKKSVLFWVDLSKKNIRNLLVGPRGLSLLVNVCELSDVCKFKNEIKKDFNSFRYTFFFLESVTHCACSSTSLRTKSKSAKTSSGLFSIFFDFVLLLANTRCLACGLHAIVPAPWDKKAVWKKTSTKM